MINCPDDRRLAAQHARVPDKARTPIALASQLNTVPVTFSGVVSGSHTRRVLAITSRPSCVCASVSMTPQLALIHTADAGLA